MSINFGPGLHVAAGRAVYTSAYDRWIGRWSRLFVPAVLEAAAVRLGCRVLDVSTGTGEAALMTLPIVGASGLVIGADISPAMLEGARARLNEPLFWPVAADGQALPFRDGSFDAVICQLGLQFFPNPVVCVKFSNLVSVAGDAGGEPPVSRDRSRAVGRLPSAPRGRARQWRGSVSLDPSRLAGRLSSQTQYSFCSAMSAAIAAAQRWGRGGRAARAACGCSGEVGHGVALGVRQGSSVRRRCGVWPCSHPLRQS
jgi:SAM-dependent methyltransferase